MYNITRGLARILLKVFFASVEVTGDHKVPKEGATIFVGNHSNQFVDALVLLTQLPRNVSFLIADKSLHRPIIGHLARALKSVSVVRSQDIAEAGVGRIVRVEGEAEDQVVGSPSSVVGGYVPPRKVLVTGKDTQFKSQKALTLGSQLQIKVKRKADGGETVAVMVRMTEVLSDEQLEGVVIDPSQQEELPLTLGGAEDVGDGQFKVLPKIDQQKMYQGVLDMLTNNSSALGIFPEGGSHDRPDLLPLKPGVVIMAMVAEARGMPVNIIPCGINYFEGHVFRAGRVVVQVGNPICASSGQRSRYMDTTIPEEKQSKNKREVCAELLGQVEVGLRTVLLHSPQYDDLQLARVTRRLWLPKGVMLPPEEFLELTRRFIKSIEQFKETHEDVRDGMQEVKVYLQDLRSVGLTDRDIVEADVRQKLSWGQTAIFFPVHIIILAVLTPISIPLLVVGAPIACLIDVMTNAEMKRALAESDVKIKGTDVAASHKIKLGAIFFPIWFILLTVIFNIALRNVGFFGIVKFRTELTIVFYFLIFPCTWLSLRAFDWIIVSWRAVKYMVKSCGRKQSELQRLMVERRRMQVKIREFVAKHFDEAAETVGFSPTRILLPKQPGGGATTKHLQSLRANPDVHESFTTLSKEGNQGLSHLSHIEVI